MQFKRRLRDLLLCLVLGWGSLLGVPMRAEEVEELMHLMNEPKIAHTLTEESDSGDDPI